MLSLTYLSRVFYKVVEYFGKEACSIRLPLDLHLEKVILNAVWTMFF